MKIREQIRRKERGTMRIRKENLNLADLDCERLFAGECIAWDLVDVWHQPDKEWTNIKDLSGTKWRLGTHTRYFDEDDGTVDLDRSRINLEKQATGVMWHGTYREFVEHFYGRTTVKQRASERGEIARLKGILDKMATLLKERESHD